MARITCPCGGRRDLATALGLSGNEDFLVTSGTLRWQCPECGARWLISMTATDQNKPPVPIPAVPPVVPPPAQVETAYKPMTPAERMAKARAAKKR